MYNFDAKSEVEYITNWIRHYFKDSGGPAIIGISGGKDSTITAALLARALGPDMVYGVLMPNGEQHDLDIAKEVVEYLKIPYEIINIKDICDSYYKCFDAVPSILSINTPPRIRMSILYGIANIRNGRVVNTCNASENTIGYSTKGGDTLGDVGILYEYYVREVLAIGRELELPEHFITKAPEDGLTGKTDEDILGFSYETLDALMLDGIRPESEEVFANIRNRSLKNRHKLEEMPRPFPGESEVN